MAGRMAGPINTKLGISTHVDPGSVLVKVRVIWRHLVNANKTPYRGPQGPREFARSKRDKYGGQRPAGAETRAETERIEARRAEIAPSRGRVLTASINNNDDKLAFHRCTTV